MSSVLSLLNSHTGEYWTLVDSQEKYRPYLIGELEFATPSHESENLEQGKDDLAITQECRERFKDALNV